MHLVSYACVVAQRSSQTGIRKQFLYPLKSIQNLKIVLEEDSLPTRHEEGVGYMCQHQRVLNCPIDD